MISQLDDFITCDLNQYDVTSDIEHNSSSKYVNPVIKDFMPRVSEFECRVITISEWENKVLFVFLTHVCLSVLRKVIN